jgi:hypothetical protein
MVRWTRPTAEQLERLVTGRDAFEHRPLFGEHLVEVVEGCSPRPERSTR